MWLVLNQNKPRISYTKLCMMEDAVGSAVCDSVCMRTACLCLTRYKSTHLQQKFVSECVCESVEIWWAEVVLAHLHGATSYQREPWVSCSLQGLSRTTASVWRMTALWHSATAQGLISLYLLIHLFTLSLVIITQQFNTYHSGDGSVQVSAIYSALGCPTQFSEDMNPVGSMR